jgi:primosomal replication protein N
LTAPEQAVDAAVGEAAADHAANHMEVSGRLVELDALRFTPAGIPVVKFRLEHQSEQVEAGVAKKVSCEFEGLAVEENARLLSAANLGMTLRLRGFMDRKSRNSQRLVLHTTHIEFVNSNSNG